jgi:hypothetical protein
MWLNELSCQYLSFKRKYYPDNLMKMFFIGIGNGGPLFDTILTVAGPAIKRTKR